jgi:hypothetical protein
MINKDENDGVQKKLGNFRLNLYRAQLVCSSILSCGQGLN